MTTKRLRKDDRREQLLEVARSIVRSQGTDALTLGYLAEQAGVTKPITYGHFKDREGLLIALYKEFDEKQSKILQENLAAGATSLKNVVRIFSTAYVDCAITTGAEVGPIVAALSGSEVLRTFLNECRTVYSDYFRLALHPFVQLQGERGEAAMVTMIGAAEAISAVAGDGRIRRDTAVEMLVGAMSGTLRVYAEEDPSHKDTT